MHQQMSSIVVIIWGSLERRPGEGFGATPMIRIPTAFKTVRTSQPVQSSNIVEILALICTCGHELACSHLIEGHWTEQMCDPRFPIWSRLKLRLQDVQVYILAAFVLKQQSARCKCSLCWA